MAYAHLIMSLTSLLAHHIRTHGPIKTARVSSAQARGRAKRYSYWGAVRYQVRLTADGQPANIACERAGSDRRSERLVERDCDELCEREGRIRVRHIGRLGEPQCRRVLEQIDDSSIDAALVRHDQRVHATPVATSLRDRAAAWKIARRLRLGLSRKQAEMLIAAAVRYEDIVMARLHAYHDDNRARDVMIGRWWVSPTGHQVAYEPHGDERDADEWRRESNHERRRMIQQACGERLLAAIERDMVLIQADDYGRLYEIPGVASSRQHGGHVVRVVCPSTSAIYWLPVQAGVRTAKAAVASTFGLSEVEYDLAEQA